MTEASRLSRWHGPFALLAALALLQAPLWINPGYFSHDELQWGARAATASLGELQWLSFTEWDRFQFRPLTFNLWLLISHALFDTPRLFHAVFVLLGSLNALLLAQVLRRAGCSASVAFFAALGFGLSPFAVWVHGWVGCLADLLWVGMGLATVLMLQRLPSNARGIVLAALTTALGTALGLYAKEAALSIPALLGLGTVLLRFPRTWVSAALASGVIALIYLVLRLETLTSAEEGSSYTLHALSLPIRWLEYQVFPWALGVEEIHVLGMAAWPKWLPLLIAPLALALCLWHASRRLWLAWLAGGVLALVPVLVLPLSANQYGYGFAALTCGVVALAWMQLGKNSRWLVMFLALVAGLHGFQIQMHMLEVGRLQAVFSPALAAQAQARPQGSIRLWPEHPSHGFVYSRLGHQVPSYRGVPLGDRVKMADSRELATHLIALDGQVRPITP